MYNKSLYYQSIRKANNHSSFHHYTSFKSLRSIFEYNAIRLTQLSVLNDPEEEGRLDLPIRNKVFVFCANNEDKEKDIIWKEYSNPEDGLRISFANLKFMERENSYFYFCTEKKIKIPDLVWEISDAKVLDIFYTDNIDDHVKYYDPIDDGSQVQVPINVGIIKRKKWESEAETRVRVFVDVKPGISSIMRCKNAKTIEYKYPKFKYIYCSVNAEILNSVIITFHPSLSKYMKKRIKEEIYSYMPDFPEMQILYSELKTC